MIRTIDIDLEFQPYIVRPPVAPSALFKQATASDEITVNTFRDVWIGNTQKNHKSHGPFSANSIAQIYGKERNRPAIIVGSGPSLKLNVAELKDTKGICVISCLHNYHYLEDQGVKPDYYVNLDAGDVTLEEISEGGTKSPEEYYASTKDKTLLTFIGASPKLIEKWQGKILWFNAPIPDRVCVDEMKKVEVFRHYVSTGGNVLGASFYIAKAILGANPIVFVGADFCFDYNNKFHPWDSKYDKSLGNYMRATDVFGMPRKTWQSYYQFKCWFDSRLCTVPGLYINATEGGLLGAYDNGNIQQIRQMALSDVIKAYSLSDELKEQFLGDGSEQLEGMEGKILF